MFRTDSANPADISGTGPDGTVLTDTAVLDRIRADGSLTLVRGPAERLRRGDWLDDLVALADMRGIEISIRDSGRAVLVLDVNWSGWAQAARSAHPSRSRGPRLVPTA